ncbi:MAG TPA: hydantoinase B/oxoprolinase family protein, partial [Pseudorhodoferax sp.]|nr:hydantoinase B/oxoprolinase family protein [Pseudorhodoferax sp.]
ACLAQGAQELAGLWRRTPDAPARCVAALAASEAAARAALAAAPDGDYRFEDALDGDGIGTAPVRVAVCIRKRGDTAELDLSGCADQTLGPVNAARGAVQAAVAYFARMLAPQAHGHGSNDGSLAPLTLRTRPGSIVDPAFPAAVNARTNLVKLLANALLGAWAQALPARMPAPNAGEVVVLSLGGTRPDGTPWLLTEIIASAAGGAPTGPGGSGVSTDVGNARSTPAEAIEAQAPLRVERVALRVGSGGAGRHRGGDGVVRVYRLLYGSGSISYRGERHGTAPQGAAGGLPGACAAARIERADGRVEPLPAKARAQWQAGDRLVVETAGGGGWGPPSSTGPSP